MTSPRDPGNCAFPEGKAQAFLVALAALAAFVPGLVGEPFGDDLPILGERLADLAACDVPNLLTQNWWGDHVRVARHYRPLALLALGAEKVVFGEHTLLYRSVGLLLHIGCSVLVWRVLLQLGFAAAALAAGLLFAVHPVHAEAVLAAYGQADLLAALGVLIGLERWCAWADGGSRRALVVSYAAFLLGLASKESAVVLPALVVLARGLALRRGESGLARWISPAELGYVVPFLIYLAARAATLESLLPPSEVTLSEAYPLWLRVQLVPVVLAHDLRLVVAPWSQAVHHGELASRVGSSALWEMLGLGLALVTLSAATRVMPARQVLFSAAWFAVTVAPVAGVIPLPVLVAERNLYLPALAPALLAGGLWAALRVHDDRLRAAANVGLALLMILALGASWRVIHEWRTPVSMWAAAALRQPDDAQVRIWLGAAYLRRARNDPERPHAEATHAARRAFDDALLLDPDLADARVGRAAVAMLDGDCATVVELLRGVATEGPDRGWIADGLRGCEEHLGRSTFDVPADSAR